jgi:hypothetical protein
MDIVEARARFELIKHQLSCCTNSYPEDRRKARWLQCKLAEIRKSLFQHYRGNTSATEIIDTMFRFTNWNKELHVYSAHYQGHHKKHPNVLMDMYMDPPPKKPKRVVKVEPKSRFRKLLLK